ncbi:hypothetical protein Y032_0314g2249 [Ancylostoma ceylanicum]|uniref:DUF229 domain-containing protein n=1 Tax=Ancylostoma ceylanicum TaxID=53326 RepID=A0A016S2Q9_9BILA|nr:hypothetical protein Y032_0314g2249 [Ancylostoma ceylanicum]
MIGIFRIRQLAVIAVVTIAFIFICNEYASYDEHGRPVNKENSKVSSHISSEETELGFKVIVTGQDAERGSHGGGEKPAGAAADSLQGQKCRIPKLDINGAEVKSFFSKAKPLECFKNPKNWVYIDDNSNVQYIANRTSAKCKGHYVTRKNDTANKYVSFDSLPSGKPMLSDFATVKCVDGSHTWEGILMSVVRKKDEDLLKSGSKPSPDGSGLNVYFLGFDSLSQMTFRRKLKKSVDVLEKTFGAVVLDGYNIVGDGTPQAFIPILTASTEEELPLTRWVSFETGTFVLIRFSFCMVFIVELLYLCNVPDDLPIELYFYSKYLLFTYQPMDASFLSTYNALTTAPAVCSTHMITIRLFCFVVRKRFWNANYVDDVYPFIWSNFSSAGYVTLYGEDEFAVGIFTYRLKGFRNQPTDHYLQTIFKEYEKIGGNCLGSEPLHKTWFRYSREFMQVYKDVPRFLLMHQGLLSHDHINLVEVEDEDLANTLLEMHKSGELDDALVIVMADHGHRFAKLRETHQGQLEERLPFFAISLPEKFRKTEHGKKMYANLMKNKDRLTTPFDIHATLMDILHLPKDLTTVQDTSKRSLSLFRPIPDDRTCAQAGVDVHWCTCLNWQDAMGTPEDKEISQQLALAIVGVINKQLKDVLHLCAKLSLKELLGAKKLVPNEGLLKYKNVKDKDGFVPDLSGNTKTAFAHYQIKLRTTPGNAIYEAGLSLFIWKSYCYA